MMQHVNLWTQMNARGLNTEHLDPALNASLPAGAADQRIEI